MAIFLTGLAVWACSGLIIAGLLARHGHNFWLLGLISLGFGPFVLLIWSKALYQLPSQVTVVKDDPIKADAGWIDVLVGLDGSDRSVESARSVLHTLGPAIGRLRLTSVIDHEVANAAEMYEIDDERIRFLESAAGTLGYDSAEISLVSGRPDRALVEHATANEFDLVVIAHRRHDIRGALRGSTAARLARTADLPVLIGPSI